MARFVMFPGAVRRLEHERPMEVVLRQRAERVAQEAKRLAPVQSGDYQESIEATSGTDDQGRVVGRVNAHIWYAHLVEFGTFRTRAHAPLRKALEAVLGNVRRGV